MGAISGEEAIAIANQYTNESLAGAGAVAGVPCQIQSITDITGGHRVTFLWVDNNGDSHTSSMDVFNGVDGQDGRDGADGKGIKAVTINEEDHLIITYSDDTTSDAGKIEIQSAVDSVNGKTGAVTLDASDVGALPDDTAIPTKTSNLTNDSGFITKAVNDLVNYYLKSETYSKTEVDNIITAVKNTRFEVVATLPTTDIKTNVIYLVPKSTSQTSNVKDEYINLDGTTSGWEKIGDTEIDLSDYVTTQALNTALADYTTTTDLTTLLAAKQDTLTFDNAPTENSNNPVKSGGVYNSEQDIYKINGFLGAKNLVQYPYFYGISGHTETLYNVDFTINDDLSITIAGTSTNSGEIYYAIKKNIYINDLKSKNLILSSGGVSGTDVWLGVYEYDQEGTSTVTHVYTTKDADTVAFTLDDTTIKINVFIRVKALATIDNVTIYPMLRYAEDIDSTYQPYAKTNQQLTEDSIDWDNFSELGAVNKLIYPYYATTKEDGGLTYTDNGDGTIDISAGTTTSNTGFWFEHYNTNRMMIDDLVGKSFKFSVDMTAPYTELNNNKARIEFVIKDSSGTNLISENIALNQSHNEFAFTVPSGASYLTAMLWIESGKTVAATTVKPMLTSVSYNGDYVPYAKTNRELTEDVTSLNAMYDGKTPSAVSDLNIPLTAGGASVALTRHLNNTTNAPTNGGGLEITWSSSDKYGAQLTLTDGGLYFRTNSSGTISAWQKIST